jgi:hypothetical protein
MLVHSTSDNQLMKNMNWFCENSIPFEWKYWMALHAWQLELKFNFEFQFLNWIQIPEFNLIILVFLLTKFQKFVLKNHRFFGLHSNKVANNIDGCFLFIYLFIYFVARFALIILWMVVTSATLQNWREKKAKLREILRWKFQYMFSYAS